MKQARLFLNFLLLFALLPQFPAMAAKEIHDLTEGYTARSNDLFAVDRLTVFNYGFPTAASGTTITLTANSSAIDDFFTGKYIEILDGPGAGQVRQITDYVGSTRIATVAAWDENPTTASKYHIYTTYATKKVKLPGQLWKDIKAEGAICDGESRTLADAKKGDPETGYASLSAARVDYPNAVALTDEIDMAAIREMVVGGEAFYIPEGTCMVNDQLSFSAKTFWMEGHPNSLIKATSTASEMDRFFNCSGCTPYLRNITFDGENKYQVAFSFANSADAKILNYEFSDIGWSATQATELVAGMSFSGTMDRIYIDGFRGSDITAVGNGHFGDEIGAARALYVAPSSNQKPINTVKNFFFDSTGSDAEELDVINQNTGVIEGGFFAIDGFELAYNGNVRRCLKIHSGDTIVQNVKIRKASDFVVASTAAGTTDVGEKNQACIDFAGSQQGSITFKDGIIDWSGFTAGFSSTAGCTDCFIRADNVVFNGGSNQVDRHDPELTVTGTSPQTGTASTIYLDPDNSSLSNDNYNGGVIDITAGTCSGNSKPVADYVGSTHILTITGTWDSSCVPDNTSVYHVYDPVTANPIAFLTGTADVGSGCNNCIFNDGYVGPQLRGYESYLKNSLIDDPVYHAFWINPTSTRSNTAQAGASTTITLDASASATNDTYNNLVITLTNGTGAGQTRLITDYDGTTKVATVNAAWTTNPDSTTAFIIAARTGNVIENNTIISRTSGRLSTGTRIAPVQVGTDFRITNNRFIQAGNSSNVSIFIDLLTANTDGYLFGNTVPKGSGMTEVRKLAASPAKVVGSGYSLDTILEYNTTPVGNVGAGTDTLKTFPIPAYTLQTSTQGVEIEFSFEYASNANAKTIQYDIGTTDIFSISLPTSQAGSLVGKCRLSRTGSSTQYYNCSGTYTGAASTSTPFGPLTGTLTKTDTSAITVKGEGIGVSNNDVVQSLHIVKRAN